MRTGIDIKIHQSQEYRAFEHMELTLSSMSSSFRLLIIYRPPPNKNNNLTFPMFLEEFGCLIGSLIANPCSFLLSGDFNFHMDVPDYRETIIFRDLLETSNLQQHVTSSTHTAGHTLDLLISNITDDLISSVSTHHDLPSDHAAVKCLINVARPPASTKKLLTRKLRSLDMASFKSDIRNSSLMTDPATNLDELVMQYDSVLKVILDHHAPEVVRSVILRPHAPWYSDTLRTAKQEKRRRERKGLKSGLAVHNESYKEQCIIYRDLVINAKSN